MTPHRSTSAAGVAALAVHAIVLSLFALLAGLPQPVHAAKPHPLFGRAVVGNSAELLFVSPSVSPSYPDYVARFVDYDSVTDAALVPLPRVGLLGGEPDSAVRYSQLDAAIGDFDGDGREDPVVARSHSSNLPWVKVVEIVWGPVDPSLGWTPNRQMVSGTASIPPNSYRSPSGVRLVVGDFDGDERDELAHVSRGMDARLEIALFKMDDAGDFQYLAWTFGETLADGLGESCRFDATAGDFDGDGDDELVVGGARFRTGSTTSIELFATVYDFADGALQLKVTSAFGNVAIGRDAHGSGQHCDHIAITTGALRPQLRDQIVFCAGFRNARWYSNACSWCCYPFSTSAYDFDRTYSAELHLLDVDTGGTPWGIGGWANRRDVSDVVKIRNDECSTWDLGLTDTSPSLGVAVGDLSGDGLGDIAMAALSNVWIYQLNTSGEFLPTIAIQRDERPSDPSRRVVAITDLDADPSKAARWTPELLFLDWTGSAMPRVWVNRPVASGGVLQSFTSLCSWVETAVVSHDAEVALVTGDLDGDAVRLGEPLYHPAISVTQPRVLLKTPPVHFDVLDGVVYDLANCYDGSGDYLCDCFQASYSKSANTTFAVKTETKTDWGVSAGLKTDHEFLGISLETSMKAEYGENFSRSGETVTSYTVEQQVMTAGQDRILADEIRYDVWEYPVYARGAQGPHTLMGHFSVVRPLSVSQPRWFTHSTWPTSYNPLRHEAGNVLSYPRFGSPEQDPNVAEMWKSDRWDMSPNRVTDVYTQVCGFNFGLSWSDVVTQGVSESWKAGVEMGASVGAYGCTVELEGHYSHEEVATRQTTVGDGIQMGVSLGSAGSVAEAPCTIQPYVYRGKDGALVLDYTVEPVWGTPGSPNWWDSYYTTSPDAAFVLPRRYHAQKGIPVQDPRTIWRTPDIWVRPDTAAVGDTVTVYATVHNFSLDALPGPVKVRLTMGDPREPGYTLIESLEGERELSIPAGVVARDTATVRMQWVIPPGAPAVPWVYAEIDAGNAISEIHEDNNLGYAVMKVAGGTTVDVAPPAEALPRAVRLLPMAPNPFHSHTGISFDLPAAARATLVIYDVAGREVAVLADGPFKAGRHDIVWNGRGDDGTSAPAGVYFCRLRTGATTETRRLLRLR